MRLFLYTLLALVVLIFISHLPGHPVNWDEPWFFELSFWKAKIGYAKTQMWQVMADPNTKQLVTHKLFIKILSVLHALKLASIYSFKILSLLFCLASAGLIYVYVNKQLSKNAALFSLICFFAISWTQLLGFTSRPEFMMLSFSLLAYLCTEKFILSEKKAFLFTGAFFAGLAVLTHLNALATMAALFILLFLHAKHKVHSLIFAVVGGLTSFLYFADLSNIGEFQLFLQQFTHDPALTKTDRSWYSPLLKVLNEHQRFFNHGEEAALSLLALFCFFKNRAKLLNQHKLLIHFGLFNIVIFAAISRSNAPNYIVMHYLLLIFLISFGFNEAIKTYGKKAKLAFSGLFVLFMALNIGASFKYLKRRNFGHDSPQELVQLIPPNSRPMITANFVYPLIGTFDLTGERLGQMKYGNEEGYELNFDSWYRIINERNNNVILLDKEYTIESHRFLFDQDTKLKLLRKNWNILAHSPRYLLAIKNKEN